MALVRKNMSELAEDSKPLLSWKLEDDVIPSPVIFLITNKGLVLNGSNPEQFFQALIHDSWITASKDAVIVFSSITRDENFNILDADFNFIERNKFEEEYHYVTD